MQSWFYVPTYFASSGNIFTCQSLDSPACLTGKSSWSDMVTRSRVDTKFTWVWPCKSELKTAQYKPVTDTETTFGISHFSYYLVWSRFHNILHETHFQLLVVFYCNALLYSREMTVALSYLVNKLRSKTWEVVFLTLQVEYTLCLVFRCFKSYKHSC